MSMKKTYDVAVIGAGVFGSWTAWHLAKAGKKVVLMDAYGPANARASSAGESIKWLVPQDAPVKGHADERFSFFSDLSGKRLPARGRPC